MGYRFARLQREPLKIALRAGALCMVHEYPADDNGEDTSDEKPTPPVKHNNLHPIDLAVTNIHGQHPAKSGLVIVPANYTVKPRLGDGYSKIGIAYNYNLPQIVKFGYAAYQLTIIPYAIMSLINLVASLCQPEFPTLFLVHQGPTVTPTGGTDDTHRKVPIVGGEENITSVAVGAVTPAEENKDDDHEKEPTTGGVVNQISAAVGVVTPPEANNNLDLHTLRYNKNPKIEVAFRGFCALIIIGSIIVPYLIIWQITGFKLGNDSSTVAFHLEWKYPSTLGSVKIINPWVIIWIAYSQLATMAWMSVEMKYWRWMLLWTKQLYHVMVVSYLLLGVSISVYGFYAVIKLMVGDTICVLL
ncbi:hypothetical protein Q9L58_004081 [Maublancomyces gigas]|uniref:Uncharacterized protein n=1 Tax=Discina gigas TaxID=1032678 RepID=A0ABR3GM70_9PEZI